MTKDWKPLYENEFYDYVWLLSMKQVIFMEQNW